jgi:uncharacterized protein (UPF0548 family)
VFLLRKPTPALISSFLRSQDGQEFSYAEVGASRRIPPEGYLVDHNRVRLGHGSDDFARAVTCLRQWRMFALGWLELFRPETPIQAGSTVAVLARALGVWSLNACRIVYVFEDEKRIGFAYGTLPDHAEQGEERFSIEWNPTDNSVWYDILAFSRPGHWLTRMGYPYARRLQKRFSRDSISAMVTAVGRARDLFTAETLRR